MFKLKNKQKTWPINIFNIRGKQIMEIREPQGYSNLVPLYREVLQDILSKWPVLLASQSIDIREFDLKETFNLISTSIINNDISITMTKDLADFNVLKEYNHNFALHIFSKNSTNWIPSVLRFGSVSLPHIVYCYTETDEMVWINSLCQMNEQFIDWFQFTGDEEQIMKLGEKAPLIYWVCDFWMYFFSSPEIINDLKVLIDKIAEENNIKPIFQLVGCIPGCTIS